MSSVHADYLIRELPTGDAALAGIEPHGTRVTLTVREGVDLKNRTVEDILRHWIIMPECKVEYREAGKAFVRVGFESPSQALMYFYDESRKEQPESWKSIEIKCKNRSFGSAQYEMAMAVESGWFPEKSFAQPPRPGLPAVCIEGIRVSDFLPGFREGPYGSSVTAIISVRGEKKLRTTVSRSGLEVDEEFINLGHICVDMFMEHIREEIDRIGGDVGKPLSRASTAGKWLSNDIMAYVANNVAEHIRRLRRQLPLIVIETIEKAKERPKFQRSLISPESLKLQNVFWTIESRLVDSLGIISRDLGRELSLNEFLASLAPEHTELGHSPILPDANLFIEDIMASHHPALVQFSRKYQQTAMQWALGGAGARDALDAALNNGDFLAAFRKESEIRIGEEEERIPVDVKSEITVAQINGDENDVNTVKTRMGTVIAEGSQVAQIWQLIEKAIAKASERKEAYRCIKCLRMSSYYAHILERGIISQHYGRNEFFEGMRLSMKNRGRQVGNDSLWVFLASEVNAILEEYAIDGEIPETQEFLLNEKRFNASDYWRDWHRTKKQ